MRAGGTVKWSEQFLMINPRVREERALRHILKKSIAEEEVPPFLDKQGRQREASKRQGMSYVVVWYPL